MNQLNFVEIEIDNKTFEFNYYSYFDNYYVNNGKNIEPETRKWFLENLKHTDVVFDIGAHIGLYTILFSLRTKNITSFEPTETYEKLLIPNLKKNNILTPKLEKLALGSELGTKKDKIFRIWGSPPEEDEYVFTTIDEYTTKNNINPTYFKIDVDSFDYEVLLGGKEFFTKNNPVICVEVTNALKYRGYKSDDIMNFMKSLDYKLMFVLDQENYFFKK